MTELVIYRGLPASGKTTLAKAWVAEEPTGRARVNRDDLRAMLHESVYLGYETESRVRVARDRMIRALLDQGVSVACDDTNLRQKTVTELAKLARFSDADVRVVDLTDVDVEDCVARDVARRLVGERDVGETVIRGYFDRYLKGRRLPLPPPDVGETSAILPYEPVPGSPVAVMVDLDGTLCLHNGRSPYDETRVGEDLPNRAVVAAVRAMRDAGYRIIVCSGRTDGCRDATWAWLDEHLGRDDYDGDLVDDLFMRKAGDKRKDAIVKRELFDDHIRGSYDVRFVLDDRQQVVDAWRELGLTVFQVAPGQF